MTDIDRDWTRLIGDRVRLRELRILHAVVRHGSMAKAAAALAMTQPAVSQAIQFLEAGLGVPLLERSPAGVVPTAYGHTILRRSLEAMDLLAEGVREVEALADPAGGEVLVGASESYIAGGVLARTVHALKRRYPRLHVHVVESNTAAMTFADLRERRVDVMLGRVALAALPDDVGQEVLYDEPLRIVAGGQTEWARAPKIGFADLVDRPWVLAPPGTAVYELVAAAFRADGLAGPRVAVTTYSMLLRLQLLAEGDYLTAFPDSLVRANAARWDLHVLPLPLGVPLPVAAFTLKTRVRTPALTAFVAALVKAGAG
jgi:DNA-binding transcriptional LysR family regulator